MATSSTQIPTDTKVTFRSYNSAFERVLGRHPKIELCLENLDYPFAHEAGVFIPDSNDLYITSNQYKDKGGNLRVQISRIHHCDDGSYVQEEIYPNIPMANGGVNYKSGVLFCSQGTRSRPAGLVYMEAVAPSRTEILLDNWHGRQFNSLNDVVVHPDGSIWFTDPIYGFEQGFRPEPQLPGQVYRFDPETKSVRMVADGFGRPNGIAFSEDYCTVYITDTDSVHGDGTTDPTRPATIYAFDISVYHGQHFLTNRRVFALAAKGIPDGIKCDVEGNVYSGCGDGIHVWSPGGILIGKIVIEGGVSNFCFCRPGEIMALNEHRLWRITMAGSCRGALLRL